jgi:(S)-2-hydroxyglutarate dehydrogenase
MLVGARDAHNAWRLRPRDLLSTLSWPGTWIVAKNFWRAGISDLRMAASRRPFGRAWSQHVPVIESMRTDSHASSGVRAQAVGRDGRLLDDFVISQTPGGDARQERPVPAATSLLALARELVDRFEISAS